MRVNIKVDGGKPSAMIVVLELTNLPVEVQVVHAAKVERQHRIRIRPAKQIVLEDVKMAAVTQRH